MTKQKEHVLPDGFCLKQAEDAVQALVTHIKKSKQKTLFEDAPDRINMDVVAFKIPEGTNHVTNINLPYSPYSADPDILFIIPDDKRNSTEPEQLVNRMKEKLLGFKITNIREVMTVTQVKNDFSTFEAKRELAKRIDVVIGMKSIFNLLPHILGREFYKKKKVPLVVELHDEYKWDEVFEKVLKKTVFNISLNGLTSSLLVGQTNLSVPELTQNVSKIVNWFMRLFPGGWKNVNQVSLHSSGVPPILIYFSKGSRAEVGKARTRSRAIADPVEGELSTLVGRHVKVHAYGNIDVIEDLEQSDDEKDIIAELNDEEEEVRREKSDETEIVSKEKIEKTKPKKTKAKHFELETEEKYVETVLKRKEFEDAQIALKKKREIKAPKSESEPKTKKKRKSKSK